MKNLSASISKHSLFENITGSVLLVTTLSSIVSLPIIVYTTEISVASVYMLGIVIVLLIVVPLVYYVSNKITETKGWNNFVDRENLWTVFFISWFKIIGLTFLASFLAVFTKIIFDVLVTSKLLLNFNLFIFSTVIVSALFSLLKRKIKSFSILIILIIDIFLILYNLTHPTINNNIFSGYFAFLTRDTMEPVIWISFVLWGSVVSLHKSFNVNLEYKSKFSILQSIGIFIPLFLAFLFLYLVNRTLPLTLENILSSYYGNSFWSVIFLLIIPMILALSVVFDEFLLTLKELFPGRFQNNKRFILLIIGVLLIYLISALLPVFIIADVAIISVLIVFIIWDIYVLLIRKPNDVVHPIWFVLSLLLLLGLLFSAPLTIILLVLLFGGFGQVVYQKVRSLFVDFNRSIELIGDVELNTLPKTVLLYLTDIKTVTKSFNVTRSLVGNDIHIRILIIYSDDVSRRQKENDIVNIRKALSKTYTNFSVVGKLSANTIVGLREFLIEERIETLFLQYHESKEDRDFVRKILVNIPTKVLAWSYDISRAKKILVRVFGTSGEECIRSVIPIIQRNNGSLFAVNSVEKHDSQDILKAASDYLKYVLSIIPKEINVRQKTFQTDDINYVINKLVKNYDLYVSSVDTDLLSDDVDFLNFSYPTLLVKKEEFQGSQLFRKIWLYLYNLLPKLSNIQQRLISLQMQKDAVANTDFYIMILLSAGIAYFGLLQNSAAVIIGGMLVAPLLTPMMAVAHSIIQGKSDMLKQALSSTIKGIGLIIFISFALTILVGLNVDPTIEILSRTSPNVLDLLVALIAGLAAAYAVSRKSLSAVLPGVAIAATLVPPLCVAGYGIGVVNLSIVMGALLLFGTNFIAIITSSMVVFLLLGFRPYQFEEEKKLFRRNLFMAVLFLFLISIPLFYATITGAKFLYDEKLIRSIVRENITSLNVDIDKLDISKDHRDYIVNANILISNDVNTSEVEKDLSDLKTRIEDTVGKNVRFDIKILKSTKVKLGN